MRGLWSAVALACLTGCASLPFVDRGPDLARLTAALAGDWDNAAQFAAAPETLKQPPAPGYPYDWLDRQFARFTLVQAPALGPHVVYLEWRKDGPDGAISRQRIWAFRADGDEVRMDFYAFKSPERFAGAAPAAFATLTLDDLIGYGEACALRVETTGPNTFDADIRPEDCRITAQSGRDMGIGARVTLMSTGLLYSEEGTLAEGGYAFKVPGGPPYEFRRR